MKAAILYGPRDLRLEERRIDVSNLKPDEIWVKTEITAFKIGTDRGNYEGAEQVPSAPDYPRWVGDSNLGVVHGVGSQVSRFQIGDRVLASQPHVSEYVAKQTDRVAKIPENVDSEDAVFAHLYSLSAYCYFKANCRPGENVAIVGLGVLGMGAVALGPLFGTRLVAVGNSPIRLKMADRMGAHLSLMYDDTDIEPTLQSFTHGSGIDLVILTANPWPAFRSSMQIVRSGGRIAVVSILGRGETALDFNPLSMDPFQMKGVSVIGVEPLGRLPTASAVPAVTMEQRYSWQWLCGQILALMSTGSLEPKRLITHRLPCTKIAEAYEMALRREKDMLGVIFQWDT